MVTQSWMYDAIIYMYALSLLFYFSDYIGSNRSAKRMGTGLLSFVWLLQTVYMAGTIYEHRVIAVYSMFETVFFFSWFLVTLSLIINRFVRIDLFVFFVNVVGFSVLALNFFSDPDVVPSIGGWKVSDELLFIHVSMAIGSYASFSVAAVFSWMYLFLHRKLKEKRWSSTMKRLPSLDKMDKYTYIAVIIGVPLLILSTSLGVVWILLTGNTALLVDPKVVNSLLVLCAYIFYLVQRLVLRASGNKTAMWSLVAFVVVLLNYIVSNFYSTFHQWVWM